MRIRPDNRQNILSEHISKNFLLHEALFRMETPALSKISMIGTPVKICEWPSLSLRTASFRDIFERSDKLSSIGWATSPETFNLKPVCADASPQKENIAQKTGAS